MNFTAANRKVTARNVPCPRCGRSAHLKGVSGESKLLNGDVVRARLARLNVTVRDLASHIHENASLIASALVRKANVHPCVVEKIAAALEIPVSEVAA